MYEKCSTFLRVEVCVKPDEGSGRRNKGLKVLEALCAANSYPSRIDLPVLKRSP